MSVHVHPDTLCMCDRCGRTIRLTESCETNHGRGVLYELFHCSDRESCDQARATREADLRQRVRDEKFAC